MSTKTMKRARRVARGITAQIESIQRARAALPWWRSWALATGWTGPARRWWRIWNERQARALKRAEKRLAHGLRGNYTMRPGAQPLPEGGKKA